MITKYHLYHFILNFNFSYIFIFTENYLGTQRTVCICGAIILVELGFYRSTHLTTTHRYDEGLKIAQRKYVRRSKRKKNDRI